MNDFKKLVHLGAGISLGLALFALACSPAAVPTAVPTKAPAATTAPAPTAAAAAATTAPAPTAAAKPSPAAQASPAAATPPPAKPGTVRFGSPGSTSDAGLYIAMEKGYFKDAGLDVQLLPFQSGPMMVAPLASGDLEVGGGTISTGLLNAIDRGVALKVVATKGSSFKGYEFSRVTVRKDLIDSGQVKEVKDLKGKNFGVAAAAGGGEAIISYFLKQGGLTTSDVNLIIMGLPDMIAAYSNKAIDAAQQIEPTLNTGVEQGLTVRWPLGAVSTFYGGEYQAGELVFSEQFIKNTDAARRFMVAYLKGLRVYNDAFSKNIGKSDVIAILTKYVPGTTPALIDKMEMPYLNPDGKMHLPSMQMDLDYFKQKGYYTGKTDVQTIVDNQFLDYAVQQLGVYK